MEKRRGRPRALRGPRSREGAAASSDSAPIPASGAARPSAWPLPEPPRALRGIGDPAREEEGKPRGARSKGGSRPEEYRAGSDQFHSLGDVLQDSISSGDQLSTQLFRNQQLRDILVQKDVELARLQEENQNLRHFLNSALVKRLEEKTKKLLLLRDGQEGHGTSKTGKRHRKAEGGRAAHEGRHPQKARRSLSGDFSVCEVQPVPPVDSWVLQTLGLKDVDTVDDSANSSALAVGLSPGSFLWAPLGAPDPGIVSEGQPGVGSGATLTPPVDSTASPRKGPSAFPLPCRLPCCSSCPLLAKTDLAFTTSLSPHCNVKTHSFRQGQAFVRRDDDGGWKLTWVPKQLE